MNNEHYRNNSKAELFKQIWKIAEELRGKVDGWDFKGYVLGFLFYRYISENITQHINQDEDDNFDYANLEDNKITEGIKKELNSNKIVIVAGFQGINEKTNDITTLGRGGSDTTAVAIAAALKAEKCDIYKDVDGVYNIDPKTNKKAFKYDYISYDDMLNLSNNGAKVLHNKSVKVAKEFNMPIHIKSVYDENGSGTVIKTIKV